MFTIVLRPLFYSILVLWIVSTAETSDIPAPLPSASKPSPPIAAPAKATPHPHPHPPTAHAADPATTAATKLVAAVPLNQTCVDLVRTGFERRLARSLEAFQEEYFVSGSILSNNVIRTVWNRRGEHIVKILTLDENRVPLKEELKKHSPTEIRDEGVYIEDKSGSIVVYLYNTTVNCSYIVNTKPYFTEIIKDEVFFSFSVDSSNSRLLFVGEGKDDNPSPWRRYTSMVGGVKNPTIFILHLDTQKVETVKMPGDLVPGITIWDPKGHGILTIARKKRYNPCPTCPDTETHLVYLNLTVSPLVPVIMSLPGVHISSPVFTPDGKGLLVLQNRIVNTKGVPVSPKVPRSLVLYSWPVLADKPDLEGRQLVNGRMVYNNFRGILHQQDQTSIFYLQGSEDKILVNTLDRVGGSVLVFNMATNSVSVLQRSMQILDVKMDVILALASNGSNYHILIGNLRDEVTSPLQLTTQPTASVTTKRPSSVITPKPTTTMPDPCQKILNSYMNEHRKEEDDYDYTIMTTEGMDDDTYEISPDNYNESTQPSVSSGRALSRDRPDRLTSVIAWSWSVDFINLRSSVLVRSRSRNPDLIVYFSAETELVIQEQFSKFWINLGFDILYIDYELKNKNSTDVILMEVEAAVNSVAKNYSRIVPMGEDLGGSFATIVAQDHLHPQVVTVDAVMNLQSLLVYRPRLLSRLLGEPHPYLPTPQDIIYLWTSSPFSDASDYSTEYLLLSTEKWPRQSESFYENVVLYSPNSEFLTTDQVRPGYWLSTAAQWIFKTKDMSQVCRLAEAPTMRPGNKPTVKPSGVITNSNNAASSSTTTNTAKHSGANISQSSTLLLATVVSLVLKVFFL